MNFIFTFVFADTARRVSLRRCAGRGGVQRAAGAAGRPLPRRRGQCGESRGSEVGLHWDVDSAQLGLFAPPDRAWVLPLRGPLPEPVGGGEPAR